MRKLLPILSLTAFCLSILAWSACEPARDSYQLALVFTADCKGYLEDCG